DAGTAVGWTRANQLAKGEKISADTVKRMASFNRHRKNSSIKPELKGTPWKDKGYVSWLIWGGDEGVDWAMKKSKEIDNMKESKQMKYIKPLNEAEKYITDEYKVGDKIKTNFGEWEVIETDYKPGKRFMGPFVFHGDNMKQVPLNVKATNKNAIGYKVTDGAKYPTYGFLYQYKGTLGNKSLITKLATIDVDESVTEGIHAKQSIIQPGEYIKTQYGHIYKRVEGKVGGQDAYVEVKKGKEGKRKTSIHDTVDFDIVDKSRALGESVTEGKTISSSKISMMGAKVLNKISIGTIFDTEDGEYEITDYGQQANAFKEFEAEHNGKKVKVKLTAMYGVKLEVTDDVRSARFNKEVRLNSIILESVINEARIKVTKDEWPYLEFKVGSKLHKVDFDYEDIIDDHGNEGQDQYWVGKDEKGQDWMIDVYANYMGDVEEVHYDTIVKESVSSEFSPMGYAKRVVSGAIKIKDAMKEAGISLANMAKLIKRIDKSFDVDAAFLEKNVMQDDPEKFNESKSMKYIKPLTEGLSKSAIKKAIKVIDQQIEDEEGGDGEPLDNETLQALEQERERLLGMMNERKHIKSINEGYWSSYEYDKWTKENGKPKYPKWVKTTLKEIVKGGFMEPVYDAEHNYMVLWLASLENKTRSETFAYDKKGEKEFGKVGYAMYKRFYNDLTSYNMFFMQGAMYALEVSKNIGDRVANGEPVEPAYYMMKEYFNNMGMDTKRSRVFNAAYEKLEKWMKDNSIPTL
ncbi:MAG: hypothetical protein HKN86_03590, partial [Acidimicrobiia bacterium]|nr:hypothetical protein [Acidimicrobiia bacterium]